MKKLLKYMKGYGKQCVLGPLFKLLEATFELLIPLVVANIVDKGIGNGDVSYIVKMCIVMIVLGIVGLISSVHKASARRAEIFERDAVASYCPQPSLNIV